MAISSVMKLAEWGRMRLRCRAFCFPVFPAFTCSFNPEDAVLCAFSCAAEPPPQHLIWTRKQRQINPNILRLECLSSLLSAWTSQELSAKYNSLILLPSMSNTSARAKALLVPISFPFKLSTLIVVLYFFFLTSPSSRSIFSNSLRRLAVSMGTTAADSKPGFSSVPSVYPNTRANFIAPSMLMRKFGRWHSSTLVFVFNKLVSSSISRFENGCCRWGNSSTSMSFFFSACKGKPWPSSMSDFRYWVPERPICFAVK